MIYCKAAGQNITEDACQRHRGFNPPKCNGCPVPLKPRVRPGLAPRPLEFNETPEKPRVRSAQGEASPIEPARSAKDPWRYSMVHGREQILNEQGEWVWKELIWVGYADAEWQEIERTLLSARNKPKIPSNLRDDVTRLMQWYVVYKTQWEGAPGVGDIKRDLEKLCSVGKDFADCVQHLNDAALFELDYELLWRSGIRSNQSMRQLVEGTGIAADTIVHFAVRVLKRLPGQGSRTLTGGEIPGRYQVIQDLAIIFEEVTKRKARVTLDSFLDFVNACFNPIEQQPPSADTIGAALRARKQPRLAK